MIANAFALLLLAWSATSFAQQWRVHSYPEDGFEVQFSGFVNVKPVEVAAEVRERIVRGTQYMQDGGSYVYVVAASLNRHAVNFGNGVEQSFAGLSCKSKASDRVIQSPWGQARELRGADCVDGNYRAEVRYHQSGLWFYQVMTLFRKDVGDEASARYFLQSFKVIK
jgi:hypothetical protein